MRLALLIIGILILSIISCVRRSNEIKIDKFIWIQHNQNRIWDPADLQARIYLQFLDSSNKVIMSKTVIGLNHSEYFTTNAPDTLRNYIFKTLYSKTFPRCYEAKKGSILIYDGDYYCIIYKFSDGSERIINYRPYSIPDSLSRFVNYLESLTQLKTYYKTDSFDRTSVINKFRKEITQCGSLAPPPPGQSERKAKFLPPPYARKKK